MELSVLQTDVTIGENQFRFTFFPTVDSIKSVASEFCISNQEVLGVAPLTEETLGTCHNPIAAHLRDVAVQHTRESTPIAVRIDYIYVMGIALLIIILLSNLSVD